MTSALASVLDRASAAAEDFKPTENALIPATAPAQSQALSAPSLDSMADGQGISVDEFLRVDKAGFQLGKMTKYFDDFSATLDLSEVIAIHSCRATRNGSTVFIKSYDGLSTPDGRNFQQAIAQLRASYDKVDVYQTSEIPMTLTADVSDGTLTVEAGTTIGLTPSVTGVKPWAKFYKKMRDGGKAKDEINVKVTCVARENAQKNKWGVAEFELVD